MADSRGTDAPDETPGPIRAWAWLALLLLGAPVVAVYALLNGTVTGDVLYLGVGLAGVAALIVGIQLHRPQSSAPWWAMALGQLLWVIADGIYVYDEHVLGIEPFPSTADVFYLLGYPVLALGMTLLILASRRSRDVPSVLDSVIVTAGLGILAWVVLVRPTLAEFQQSPVGASVGAAYPIGDILLIGGIIRLLTSSGSRSPTLRLLLAAVGCQVIADTIYAGLGLYGAGESAALDYFWLGSYLLWGAAALHPSMVALSRPTEARPPTFGRRRLVAMTLATLVAPAILAVQTSAGLPLDVWGVIVGSILLFLLVVARMRVTIQQMASISAEREKLARELEFRAAHDSLTELPNRPEAVRALRVALARAGRRGDLVALLFVDLDGFKAVNDTHGHRCGDQVLRIVARRLRSEIRAGDLAARLGGDEFLVLLEPVDSQESAVGVAERLIAAVSEPIVLIDGEEVVVGASIGIALNQDGQTETDAFLHEADLAVYQAKGRGRGRVEVFSSSLRHELVRREALEGAVGLALERDEFVAYYQPIIDAETDTVAGYEALVRWDRPGVGLVPPSEFVPVAETSDLICDIDTWMLDAVAGQLAAWNRDPATAGAVVTVNVSGRHINRPRIRADVAAVLERHAVDPAQLVVEITETVLVNTGVGARNLRALREMGVRIALDDFGTGFCSIASLAQLPVDFVKIDRSYVDPKSASQIRLLKLMVHTAHTFGLPVIGEGVESPRELALLKMLQVEGAQGYLFGRPMAAPDLAEHRLAPLGESRLFAVRRPQARSRRTAGAS